MVAPTPIPPEPEVSAVMARLVEHKQLLHAQDAETMIVMGKRWVELERTLEAQISLLAREMSERMAAGEDIGIGTVLQLERYQLLLSQLDDEMVKYNLWVLGEVRGRKELLATMGAEHSANAIQTALMETGLGMGEFFNRLPATAIENIVAVASPGGPLQDLFEEAFPLSIDHMTRALIEGVGLGLPPGQTALRMFEGMSVGFSRIVMIARTEQLRSYREASRQQYALSGSVTSYERFCAKQVNTCMACIALDGEIYPTSDLMNVHPNDRCTMIPHVRGAKRIERELGRDWFARQDSEIQKEMLGPGRFKLYEQGEIGLDDLVIKKDHPVWGPSLGVTNLGDLRAGVAPVDIGPVDGPAGDSLSANFSYRESKASVHFDQAIEDMDKVFVGNTDLETIKVSGYSGRGEGKFNPETGKIQINNRSQHPELSFIHETGHAMDYRVLPDALGIESKAASLSFESNPMDDFWEAIENSSAIQELRAMRDDDPDGISYLLDVREVHARAFSQYIAETSGSQTLMSQLDSIRENAWYPEQWTTDDFALIKNALDELYGNAGLLRGG